MSKQASQQMKTIGDSPLIQRLDSMRDKIRVLGPEQSQDEKQLEEEEIRRTQLASRRKMARRMCGLEERQWEYTLDSFPSRHPSQAEALSAAKRFAAGFPGTKERPYKRGLYLWGEPGRGKSAIMAGLVQAILEKPRIYRVLYIPCAEIEALREKIDIEISAIHADLIVLDDIEKGLDLPGTKFRSPGDGIIRRVINRADRTRSTLVCVTSNHSLSAQRKQGGAFASRLAGLTREFHVDGPDMRTNEETKEPWQDALPYWAK